MKAALLEAYQAPLAVRQVADPRPSEHGAVVRVMACGVCRSDWHAWQGHWPGFLRLPHVLGHELCGVVEEVGAGVSGFARGDRVLAPFNGSEGGCPQCRKGRTNLCDFPLTPGFSRWGGFAEYVAIEQAERNLAALPGEVEFTAAAGMGCRFMTAFHALTARARLAPGEWLAVYGCGGVGLSAVQIAVAAGAYPVCVDINAGALALAQSLGACAVVDARGEEPPAEAVRRITGGGADVALDALGHAETCRNALLSLGKRGRHVQVGMSDGEDSLPVPVDVVVERELSLLGSKGMPTANLDMLLRLVATGRLQPMRLVSRTVSLEQVGAVLQDMSGYGTQGFVVVDRF